MKKPYSPPALKELTFEQAKKFIAAANISA